MTEINCPTHGRSERAFVCQHIAKGLLDHERVGFFWSRSETDNPHPDAWCARCENRRLAEDGEWRAQALEEIQAKIMCAGCYALAKVFHLGGQPWS